MTTAAGARRLPGRRRHRGPSRTRVIDRPPKISRRLRGRQVLRFGEPADEPRTRAASPTEQPDLRRRRHAGRLPDFARRSRSRPLRRSPLGRRAPRTRASGGGGHRNDGGRRGVSIGVIVALVAVVVVVGTVILWRFFGDALSNRSHNAAGRCVGGKETVAVIADPSIADHVQQFADRFNASAGPVGDHCMCVSVKPAGSDAVVDGFIGKWPARTGPAAGAVDPGQLGLGRAADRRGGQENHHRQPVAGHLAGGAGSPARTPASARPTRTGRRCPGCKPNPTDWPA